MSYRSWLVVSGNSEKKLGNAVGTGADAVVIDLVSSNSLGAGQAARRNAAEWLEAHRSNVVENQMARWVRINPMEAGSEWRQDLLAVMPAAPDGIMLPRAAGPDAVRQLAAELYELEQLQKIPANSTRIIPFAGETARSALTIGQYLETGHQRLFGLAWGADGLIRSIAATRATLGDGVWSDAVRQVRAQVLLTAHACGVLAIDTVATDITDKKTLKKTVTEARADGFSGMIASQPDRIVTINEAFAPSEDDIREAQDIVAAFDANPRCEALNYQGRMIDKPILTLAQRTLQLEHTMVPDQAEAVPILRPA